MKEYWILFIFLFLQFNLFRTSTYRCIEKSILAQIYIDADKSVTDLDRQILDALNPLFAQFSLFACRCGKI